MKTLKLKSFKHETIHYPLLFLITLNLLACFQPNLLNMAEFDLKHEVQSTRLIVDTSVAACELVANDLDRAVVIERFALWDLSSGQNISIVGDRVPFG